MNRASHWLALASGEIGQFLGSNRDIVNDWLKTQFNIDWSANEKSRFEPILSFRILKKNPQAFTGSTLQIPWKLINTGSQESNQISLFLRSDVSEVPTKEILIGKVKARDTHKGVFQVKIPMDIRTDKINFTVGVAVNALPLSKQTWHFDVPVIEKNRPDLVFDYDLVDENKVVNGILEAGEHAKVKVYVKNNGQTPSQPIEIKFVSLAGRQINLSESTFSMKALQPGEEGVQYVPITGSKYIVNEFLKLGMTIRTGNIPTPIQKSLSLRSIKNRNYADKDIAH